MNAREHSGVEWAVVRWVVYGAALIDFSLFYIWFSVPIAAIRISGLILAIVIGGIGLLNLPTLEPATIETRMGAFLYFTIAVILGLGNRLSSTTAFGIFALVGSIVMLFGIFRHRRDEKPWLVAIGMLMFLGFGTFGIFLIYVHPSFTFTLDGAISGIIGGFIGGLVAPFIVKRHRASRERNPEAPGSTVPPRRLIRPW